MQSATGHAGSPSVHSVNPTMRVMSLVIPLFLLLDVAYVLYAVVGHVLIGQFKHEYHRPGLAIGLAVPYVVIAAFMVASYLGIFLTIRVNPGVVALGPEAARAYYNAGVKPSPARQQKRNGGGGGGGGGGGITWPCGRRHRNKTHARIDSNKRSSSGSTGPESEDGIDLESGVRYGQRYGSTPGGFGAAPFGLDPRLDPDSPGLELFYTKDVFECMADGRPVFCSPCGTWKPDRTHHCSEINRCVRKMDHFCPWVGGIVSETTFKFFLQFAYYATVLCALTVSICGYAVWLGKHHSHATDARVVVALALAAFLGLFAFSMAIVCTQLVFANLTAVESQQLKRRTKLMAVRIQRGSPAVPGKYNVVTYPLPKDGDPAAAAAALVQLQQQQQALEAAAENDMELELDPLMAGRKARAARRAARDMLAYRTFAIVPVPMGTNVWDLGWRANWTSVMGTHVVDWLTPFRLSPCCSHDSTHSFYPLNPAFQRLCNELGLPPCQDKEEARHW